MEITASMVKELREKTGAGLMDCKKALVETQGNMEEAVTWLREKGIMKAAKKAARIAAEGICEVAVAGDKAILFELNCETDFVAQNEKFKNIVASVSKVLLESGAWNDTDALDVKIEGKTLREYLLEHVATIGENISLRRFEVVKKNPDQIFGQYIHMGGKIASLAVLTGGNPEMAKDIAMQVAAASPRYVSQADISQDVIDQEREILTKEAENENAESAKPKPREILLKMVEGRLQKNLKEICLVNQPFIKNPDQTIEQYVKSKNASVADFRRLSVGEGIEKKEDNFAEEVMSQVK